MCPRTKSLEGCFIPLTMRPLDGSPLDDASLGQRVPCTMRPLDDTFLTDVSWLVETDWPFSGIYDCN